MLPLILALSLNVCDDLKNIDLSGQVVREVHRAGQVHTDPAVDYKVETKPYSIPGIEFTINRLEQEGGKLLSKVFVSSQGALMAVREVQDLQSCLLVFVPINEKEWVVPMEVTNVGRRFVTVRTGSSHDELLVYKKISKE